MSISNLALIAPSAWYFVATCFSTLHLYHYYSGCPKILRADDGTENVCAGTAQIALRLQHEDGMAGATSFLTGASVHNVVCDFMAVSILRQNALFCRK